MRKKTLTPEEKEAMRKARNRKLFDRYKTYSGGERGSPASWAETAQQRLEGVSMVVDADLAIFGFSEMPTMAELSAARRRIMMAEHPDHGGSTTTAASINEAFNRLKEKMS